MADSKPSGKVGAQERGRGERVAHGGSVGGERTPGAVDHVDAGIARKVKLEQINNLGGDEPVRHNNLDRVDNDNPMIEVVPRTGDLSSEGKSMEEKVKSVEGIQSGGAAAQDTPFVAPLPNKPQPSRS